MKLSFVSPLSITNQLNYTDLISGFIKNEKVSLVTNITTADVLFCEWNQSVSDLIKTNKGKTFIIFDRFLSINVNDANWLRKQGVILTEPALNFRRKYFHYVPFWIKTKSLDYIELNNSERQFDLIYYGNTKGKLKSLEKYYNDYSLEYKNSVLIQSNNIPLQKLEENGVPFYGKGKATVIIGSPLDYQIGYLDYQFINALENNCIPLIPNEHKYFTLLSPYKFINPVLDMYYITFNYKNSYIGYILDVYKTIEEYYPEMLIENVIEQILDLIKTKG